VRFAAKRKRGQKAAPFASDCAARTFLTAAVDLDPKERRHPEPGALKRNVVILSRRFLPSEGSERAARRAAEAQKRAFSTLPNCPLSVVELLRDLQTTHYFYDSWMNRVNMTCFQ
jgi:hypothetical protein